MTDCPTSIAPAQRGLHQWLSSRTSSTAEDVMLAEGVKNIEAMTEFLCPGCRPPQP